MVKPSEKKRGKNPLLWAMFFVGISGGMKFYLSRDFVGSKLYPPFMVSCL